MTDQERTRFEVLLEDVQRNVRILAEGHGVVVERLDRLDSKVSSLDTKVSSLDTDMREVKQRLGRIEDHLELNGAPRKIPRKR